MYHMRYYLDLGVLLGKKEGTYDLLDNNLARSTYKVKYEINKYPDSSASYKYTQCPDWARTWYPQLPLLVSHWPFYKGAGVQWLFSEQ